jgi:hypothetical protein
MIKVLVSEMFQKYNALERTREDLKVVSFRAIVAYIHDFMSFFPQGKKL